MKRNIEFLRVLPYHTIYDTCSFEKLLVYLKENYSIISIEQLSLFLSKRTESPKNPTLITFDDEDISVYENALKFLKKDKELFK